MPLCSLRECFFRAYNWGVPLPSLCTRIPEPTSEPELFHLSAWLQFQLHVGERVLELVQLTPDEAVILLLKLRPVEGLFLAPEEVELLLELQELPDGSPAEGVEGIIRLRRFTHVEVPEGQSRAVQSGPDFAPARLPPEFLLRRPLRETGPDSPACGE